MSSVEDFKIDPNKELQKLYKNSKSYYIAYLGRKFSMPKDLAVDIFQRSIVILWQNIESGKFASGEINPYLTVIVRNLAHAQSRQIKKERNLTNSDIAHKINDYLDDNDLTYKKERVDLLRQGLEQLEGPCQKLLKMIFYENKKTDELIDLMEYKNANTLKTKKYKCLKRLRNLITDISNRK